MPVPLIVSALLSQGLSLLGNAVLAKGQDVIEEKLGISLSAPKSPADIAMLKKIEMDHEDFLIQASLDKVKLEMEAEKVAQEAVTHRWEADMLSDSYLSKNVRPIVLIYWTFAVSMMAFFSHELQIDEAFVELIKVSYTIILTAYFVGRTAEKFVDMRERGKL